MTIARSCLLLPLLALLAAAAPGEETNATGDADLERNRQLLTKWKADPEHYARLRRDLHDFWELPKPRRQQIRRLDQDFHQLDAKTQKRLWKVAERYTTWEERLPVEQRRQIEATKDPQERLQLIRTIREQQWLNRLPRKVREELEKLPPEARAAKEAKLREQEKQQRQQWKRPIAAATKPKGAEPKP